ncbi:MAG: LytTR family DNA-binding domain-containing protein [Dorea sp.]|nr:LytTR family DNA-binding domain-containing protein [Dorea sp.]MDY2814152.1 LytTR family DNA-binding domain-containing protein [Dorea sp.]
MIISICDLNVADVTQTTKLLDASMKKYMIKDSFLKVDTFTSADELLASQKDYTLIFLGIKLPGTNGLEAARQLKKRKNPPIIIFTTVSPDHCLESYDLGVEGYLLKPISEEKFDKIFSRYLLPAFPPPDTLNIYSNRLLFHIPVREIYYIESVGRKCIIHTSNQVYETNLALNSIETTLSNAFFVRCYRSYLVNMNYIQAILDLEILLRNGERIPLTLRKRSFLIKTYSRFLTQKSLNQNGSSKI